MKKKRCKHGKHEWQVLSIDDPLPFRSCYVHEQCSLCGELLDRRATEDERQSEIKRVFCPTCGYYKNEHDGSPTTGCIALLAGKIRDLTDRLDSLEDWRRG